MKKILIATSCAITLCLTSCATKQAPQTDSQIEAPETETDTEASADENTQTDSEQQASDNSENSQTGDKTEESENNSAPTSEDFPEPETIDEPEIITLEPVTEPEPSENASASEEVENEEPPAITIQNSNESNEAENQADASETEINSVEAEDNNEDITANDVIIISNPDSDGISGGIDITDDDTDVSLNELEKDTTPSRSVTLKKFEYLDVTYPGTGWIYMGLTDNSKDLAYFGRKLGTKDTKFSLQARAAGTKIIHFYRNDPLTGQYLDDYVEVIILAENGSNKTHVAAPEYKLPVQKKEKPAKKLEETSEEITDEKAEESAAVPEIQPAKQTIPTPSAEKTPAVTSTPEEPVSAAPVVEANPDSLLQEAQVLYNEKEYKAALSKLNQFFEYSTDKGDEALYLKGQILEAKSEIRDIKGSIDAYTTLTKNYPASKFWDSANKRIIYLKRFYLEVR